MNKAQQLVIAVFCGFPADHELITDALSAAKPGDTLAFALLDMSAIDKETLFSPASNGKSIFEYKESWDNLAKLDALLGRNGEAFTRDDFSRTLAGGKTMAELAAQNDSLPAVFAPPLWKGHRREMEDLWFSLSGTIREKHDFRAIRRKVAKAEGVTLREDRLDAMGIPADDVRRALQSGEQWRLEKLVRKLAGQGDYLRKDDLFLMDEHGETVFDQRATWENFENIWAALEANGEKLTIDDYLFSRGENDTPLKSAATFGMVHKIFTAVLWQDDPDSMIELFNHIPEDEKYRVDLQAVLADINQNLYGDWFEKAATRSSRPITLAELTAVLNPKDPAIRAVTPLGLKTTWDRMDEITAILEAGNEKLTRAHLRAQTNPGGDTYLMRATFFGHFETALHILRRSGEHLTISDLTDENKSGKSIINLLIEQDKITRIIDPTLWPGRSSELLALYDKLPHTTQQKINKQNLIAQINKQSLRNRFAPPNTPTPPQPQP